MESNLIDWLIEKGGKPEEYTWKQVGKMFRLTGEAARGQWKRRKKSVTSKGQNTSTATEGLPKEIPGYIVSSFRSEGAWYKKLEEVEEDGASLGDRLEESFDKILDKYHDFTPISVPNTSNKKSQIISITDCHVGSEINKNNMFGVEYSATTFAGRIQQVVDFVISSRSVNNIPFENFTLFDLGDALDGANNSTSRGGHFLPQNLNNSEQWETYVDVLTNAWKQIVEADVAQDYNYVCASNSNHSGEGFDYIAMQAVAKIVSKLWGVNTSVSKKFIDHTTIESRGVKYFYLYTHGKDFQDRKFGLPLTLEHKSREYIQGVMDKWGIPNTNKTVVLKGDLHQYAATRSHNKWHYVSCPSLLGSSGHSINNYTATEPGFYFEILDGEIRMTGVVDVK